MLKDIKYTGLNTVSSGYDATAGQLAVAHNVINERGYIEPVTQPKKDLVFEDHGLDGYKCMFRHEMLSGTVNGIFYRPDDDESSDSSSSAGDTSPLMFLPLPADEGDTATEITCTEIADAEIYQIAASGNTLCVLTSKGIDYFKWNGTTYSELGMQIPEVNIRFGLKIKADYNRLEEVTSEYLNLQIDGQVAEVENEIHAKINTYANDSRKAGRFVYPFQVRYALRLYDGSLVHHSSPVLMVDENQCAPIIHDRIKYEQLMSAYFHTVFIYHTSANLMMNIENAIPSEWRDIVTGVEIYASAPFQKFPDDETPLNWTTEIPYVNGSWDDGFGGCGYGRTADNAPYQERSLKSLFSGFVLPEETTIPERGDWDYNYQVVYADKKVDIADNGLFYKIFEYDSAYTDDSSKFQQWNEVDVGNITDLTTHKVMTDDYRSHDIIMPTKAYAYNQRLNLYGISALEKLPFKAYTYQPYLTSNDTGQRFQLCIKVIDDNGEEKWLGTEPQSTMNGVVDKIMYIFVPFTNVVDARFIYGSGTAYLYYRSLPMRKHATLNGSVWFNDFEKATAKIDTSTPPFADTSLLRHFPNKVYTSEVGNPFYFPLGGINTIGTSRITALAANVRAISLGQFGEYPLYVFTESGIWMLEVDDKGLYKAKQPMSLDVIEPGSQVTSVNDSVAYVIKRGLMLVSGSETRCISEALDGIAEPTPDITEIGGKTDEFNWNEYKKNAVCAYDNVNQRLHVYNPTYAFDWLHNEAPYHYVYSLKTGLWSTMEDDEPLLSTIDGRYVNTASGLLDMTTEDSGQEENWQTILTRPVNFETDAYKRMRDNIQRGDLDLLKTDASSSVSNIKVLLQASDDLHNWQNVGAVTKHYKIIRKSGTPHKWFRWMIVIKAAPKDYKLHGLTADMEVTGNNKLR